MISKPIKEGIHQQAPGLQIMNKVSLLCDFVKVVTQFILSISVFSFFFLHPSWLYFTRSFMPHQSKFSCQLFSLATDKNCIFLLCNGILFFIAKYSSRAIDPQQPLPSSEVSIDNDIIFKEYTQTTLQPTEEKLVLVEYVAEEEGQAGKSSEANVAMKDEEIEENSQCLTTDGEQILEEVDDGTFDDDMEEYGNRGYEGEYYVEKEEQEDREIAMMSTEELNRRFEDFIRKMKEELRI